MTIAKVSNAATFEIAQDSITFEAADVLQLVKQLQQTSSMLARRAVIAKTVQEHPAMQAILYYALSTHFATFVGPAIYHVLRKTVADAHKIVPGTKTLKETWNEFIKLHNNTQTQQLSGTLRNSALFNFFTTCDQPTAAVYLGLFAKNLFKNITGKSINEALAFELIPIWGVQLCATYSPMLNYSNVAQWYATPKLNGFRAIYKNGQLYSRSGKLWKGAKYDVICTECQAFQQRTGFNLIDGELLTFRGNQTGSLPPNFQDLSSVLRNEGRRADENWNVFMCIFAAVNTQNKEVLWGSKNAADMYSNIYTELPATPLDKLQTPFLNPEEHSYRFLRSIPHIVLPNIAEKIIEQCVQYTSAGYEGIILRHPAEYFNLKRSSKLLKYKMFKEMDLQITGVVEGLGKYKNMLGALELTGKVPIDSTLQTIRTSCGTGFSDEQRQLLWDRKEEILGRTVVVKYQDITEKKFDDTRALFFPTFVQLK